MRSKNKYLSLMMVFSQGITSFKDQLNMFKIIYKSVLALFVLFSIFLVSLTETYKKT